MFFYINIQNKLKINDKKFFYLFQGSAEDKIEEAIEGILDQNAEDGTKIQEPALSVTQVEVFDLISEGEIEGLVTGKYKLEGTEGNIGWATKVSDNFYPNAPGTNINYLRSIYWNETPVVSSDDKFNFQNIDLSYTRGFSNGSSLSDDLIPAELTVSRAIGERLRGTVLNPVGTGKDVLAPNTDYSKIYSILNKECIAVIINIKVHSLSKTITAEGPKTGDIEISEIKWFADYRPIFSTPGTQQLWIAGIGLPNTTIKGKVTSPYIKSNRLDFDKGFPKRSDFIGWQIKIVRSTLDSTSTTLRNTTSIDSLTEIYGNRYTYPNSAIVRQKFNAEFFSQVPNRSFDVRLLKVKIPNNYDPIKHSYGDSRATIPTDQVAQGTDFWDGSFQKESFFIGGEGEERQPFVKKWTDNPAWCYYDLITNKRYGLGKYIEETQVDKWTLYEIAKYCDTLVSDGYGKLEPRFSCNLIITSREDAYKVVNDMASIFRGFSYYGVGTIFAIQDRKKTDNEIITLFTNSNVENGDFTYSSTKRKDRHSIAVVRYNDKTNFYKPAIEYVEDFNALQRYGIREIDVSAFGCTSRGQAVRLGKWILLSETLETELISFTVGMEGAYLKVGDVIKVYDANRKSSRYAGRIYKMILSDTSQTFILDSVVTLTAGNTYDFCLITPTYNYNPLQISDLNSTDIPKIDRSHLQTKSFLASAATPVSPIEPDRIDRTQIVFNSPDLFNNTDYKLEGNPVWTIEQTTNTTTDFNDTQKFINRNIDYYKVNNIAEKDVFKFDVSARQYVSGKYDLIEDGLSFEAPSIGSIVLGIGAQSGPDNLILYYNSGTNIIDYSFTASTIEGVAGWEAYARAGMYDPTYITTGYLINSLPVEVNEGQYTPTGDGTYYFRVYGIDSLYNHSTGYLSGDIAVVHRQQSENYTISSLGFQLDTGNAAGTQFTGGRYFDTDPIFVWQVGIKENAPVIENTFRFTARSPSSTNIPSSTIYYQNSGIPFDTKPTFTFTLLNNIGAGGPYREYDAVVEVIDSTGRTSAGNYITSTVQESWSNPNGYDIFNVYNDRLTGVKLTSGSTNYAPWISKQNIDINGDIQVVLTGNTLPKDIEGGYVYFSQSPFSATDVINLNSSILATHARFDRRSQSFYAPTKLRGIPSGYIMLGLYDTFDDYFITNNYWTNPWTGMTTGAMTNMAPVWSSGDISNLTFHSNTRALTLNIKENPNDENNLWLTLGDFGPDTNYNWVGRLPLKS